MKAHLSLHAISKYFRQADVSVQVLKDISFSFEQGKTYALMGSSGSGKSTLIYLLSGLDAPTEGMVAFNDYDIARFSEHQRSLFLNKSLGLVFQWPYLIRELSVLENVMLPGLLAQKNKAACKKKAEELLERVGLIHKIKSKPSALSGGQQQRVALARALVNEPVFLLADEPTGSLDSVTGTTIMDLLLLLQKELHMGIIISTHDDYVAERMERRLLIRDGHLVSS